MSPTVLGTLQFLSREAIATGGTVEGPFGAVGYPTYKMLWEFVAGSRGVEHDLPHLQKTFCCQLEAAVKESIKQ